MTCETCTQPAPAVVSLWEAFNQTHYQIGNATAIVAAMLIGGGVALMLAHAQKQ
jgi:hypothetical protein